MGISGMELQRLERLLAAGQEHGFYTWGAWRRLRAQVLAMDRRECQMCKARGRYRRAEIVHHVKPVKERPDLALSVWDGEQRQLVSVCKRCHEQAHPESQRPRAPARPPVTAERWD